MTWLWGLRAAQLESPSATDDVASSATRSHEREDELTAASDKLGGFLYATTLRVAVAGTLVDHWQAQRKLDELCGVVSATAIPRLASFQRSKGRRTTGLPSSVRERPFLLSAKELATLFHPPTRNMAAENLAASDCRRPEPPAPLPNPSQERGTVALGRVRYRDRQERFGICAADRRRHAYVLGKTGMGKSTLIENMLVTDIHAGRGVGLIDPHGDLAERVARSVPQKYWHKVVLVDPADTAYPVAFNPLDGSGLDATQRALLASAVLGVFKTMYAEAFHAGYRMEDIFRNAFLALVEDPDATLLSLPRLLEDEAYRTYVAAGLSNQVVRDFWLQTFPGWSKRYRGDAVGPVENKVRGLMSNPLLQPILGQSRSKLRLRQVMDEGKILIVNLSKGNCGEDASDLLGRLLVAKIQQAAMSRSGVVEEDRRDFYLYVDEFQNYATESFETILSEARKYRLNLTLAHQYLGQLDRGLRDAVMGNVGTTISFALGGEDAEILAGQFHGPLTPADFVHLPKYQAYVALMVAGRTCDPFLMQTIKPPASYLSDANLRTLVNLSRQRYAQPLAPVGPRLARAQTAM